MMRTHPPPNLVVGDRIFSLLSNVPVMGLQTKDIGPDYYILMGLSLSLSLYAHVWFSYWG